MQRNKIIAAVAASLMLCFGASAQDVNSLNAYSPYTFYGIGDLSSTSGASFDAMGGTSIAFRSYMKTNLWNPAAFSAIAKNSMIFEAGASAKNTYSTQYRPTSGKMHTSDNSMNFNNVSLLFPLTKGLGMGISVLPYSSVGYHTQRYDTSNDVTADIGTVLYTYEGNGNITQAKLGLGWEPFKNFSLGAELVYYHGNINRDYNATIVSYTGSGTYNSIDASTNERMNRFTGNFGLQWNALSTSKTMLTFGVTYRMGIRMRPDITDYIPSNDIFGDTVRYSTPSSKMRLPNTVGAGVFLHRTKWSVGVDYVWQDWGRNAYDAVNEVGYRNTNMVRVGALFTPNRFDVRKPMNRVTYKVGFRYNDYYIVKNNTKFSEKAISFGVEFPFKMMKVSNCNLGVEYGWRGTLHNNMIREQFLKFSVGVTLFGGDFDYWFVKKKFK